MCIRDRKENFETKRDEYEKLVGQYYETQDERKLNELIDSIKARYADELRAATADCDSYNAVTAAIKAEKEDIEAEIARLTQIIIDVSEEKRIYQETYCYETIFLGEAIEDFDRRTRYAS